MEKDVIIGSAGVGILLVSFFLVLFKQIRAEGLLYSAMNFAGACIAGYASILISYLPFVVLEYAWAAVALAGMVRSIRTKTFY